MLNPRFVERHDEINTSEEHLSSLRSMITRHILVCYRKVLHSQFLASSDTLACTLSKYSPHLRRFSPGTEIDFFRITCHESTGMNPEILRVGVIASDTAATLPRGGLPPNIVDRIKMGISHRSNRFNKNYFLWAARP